MRKPTAKENAHFVFCPKLSRRKKQKEHFPSLFLPTLKKRINFLLSIPKNQPCRIDGTAYNKSFARLRGKVQNSSLLPIFEHWCLIESFGIFSPPFANTFSVVAKSAPLLSPQRFGGLHPLLVRAASRTSHNKQIC